LTLNAANGAKPDQIGDLSQQAGNILGFDEDVGLPGMRKRVGAMVRGDCGRCGPVLLAPGVGQNILVPVGTIDT
jgi:hypothetical protein